MRMSNWLTSLNDAKMTTDLTLNEAQKVALKAKLAWFKLSHALDLWSLFVGMVAALGLFFASTAHSIFQGFFGLSLVLSIVQKYYALRVQYDIALFEAWLSVQSPTLAMLDDALQAQFGIKPSGASLEQRLAGLANLFYRQVLILGLQTLTTIIGLALYWRL